MSSLVVLYDACVLYSAPLRDLLMHLALTEIVEAKWSDDIHEEWIRAVLKSRPDLRRDQLERTRDLMNAHAGECLVTDYHELISTLDLPDPNDRHVLAAAIRSRAEVIVTFNLSDFPSDALAPYGIEAQHPDAFVVRLIELDSVAVCTAAKRQRKSLEAPSKNVDEYLAALHRTGLDRAVQELRLFSEYL